MVVSSFIMTPHNSHMQDRPAIPRRRIKVSMTLSLDIDIVQWLATISNRSAFVNDILRQHIQTSTMQSPEYREQKEKELKRELLQIKKLELKE